MRPDFCVATLKFFYLDEFFGVSSESAVSESEVETALGPRCHLHLQLNRTVDCCLRSQWGLAQTMFGSRGESVRFDSVVSVVVWSAAVWPVASWLDICEFAAASSVALRYGFCVVARCSIA